ncbi:MAG: 3-isopropylmalate dehydratase [Proteobacteria bacterium]|nr:3-isopropylmalate dehydratase [Pseudomonadota bacterium]
MTAARPFGRLLFLCADAQRVRAQLDGAELTRAQAGALRDDISTDEISPLPAMVHFDAALGAHAHTGFTASGERPIGRDALRRAGVGVLVGGRRYGKGSSREHSPLAEASAGVRLVIAESFERIYRQNADNLGLLTSTDLGLVERLQRGEVPTLDELLAERDAQAAAILRAGGLLRYGRGPVDGSADDTPADDTPAEDAPAAGPQTLFEKIVARHRLRNGFVRADLRFIHEYYTGMCAHLLAQHAGGDVRLQAPDGIVCFEDHLSYARESPVHVAQGLLPGVRRLQRAHRDFVARHGLKNHGVHDEGEGDGDGEGKSQGEGSQGISHAVVAERYARPGQLIVGTDSHTPHSGALGCVAFGVGSTEMANAFLTGAVRLGTPEVLRIEVDGALPPGVSAKDLALHLLARPDIRAGAGVGRVFEFGGAAVRALDIDERATLTNMTAELGGLAGLVEPDETTVRFLRQRRGADAAAAAIEPWMRSDPGARYAATIRVAAGELSPMVARPGDPGLGLPLAALAERPRIHIAYGGSCTAGKRADFEQYHAVLAWAAARGLRVAPHVSLYLQFGTDDVAAHAAREGWIAAFDAVGARILQPACGACANCGPGASTAPEQVTVSAINRNFPGRSGPGQVWLASPATVAASAIAGRLASFAELIAAGC